MKEALVMPGLLKVTFFVVKRPQGLECHHRLLVPQLITPVGYWPLRTWS